MVVITDVSSSHISSGFHKRPKHLLAVTTSGVGHGKDINPDPLEGYATERLHLAASCIQTQIIHVRPTQGCQDRLQGEARHCVGGEHRP